MQAALVRKQVRSLLRAEGFTVFYTNKRKGYRTVKTYASKNGDKNAAVIKKVCAIAGVLEVRSNTNPFGVKSIIVVIPD